MVFQRHVVETIYTVGPVNFYTFSINGFNIMFDTGPNAPNVLDYYEKNIDLSKIDGIFITHCHVDHDGIIDHIKKKTKAKIFFPKYDYLRNRYFKEVIEGTAEILREEGFKEDAIIKVKQLIKYFEKEAPNTEGCFIVEENLKEIKAMGIDIVYAPWHSQSDLIYVVGDYAISGDVLLEDIVCTPLLSIDLDNFGRRFMNFNAFIDTIIKIKHLEDKIFLPGHREEIKNIENVLFFQINKFVERAKKIGPDITKKNIYSLVFDNIDNAANDPYALYIKTSEMFFLRDYELNKEKLVETLKSTFPQILKKISFSA